MQVINISTQHINTYLLLKYIYINKNRVGNAAKFTRDVFLSLQ